MRGLLFLGALGFLVVGAYDLFIETGVSGHPTPITIGQFEAAPPWNRYVTITDGKLLILDSVKYWRTRRGVSLSEEYYIPIKDNSLVGIESIPPSVLVKVSKSRMEQIIQHKRNAEAIQGIRMTKWDMAGKVKELIEKTYGERTAKKILIIDLERTPAGFLEPLCKLVAGIGMAFLTIVPWSRLSMVRAGRP